MLRFFCGEQYISVIECAIVIINVRVRNALLLDSSFALKQFPAFIPHFRQTLFIFYFIFQTFTAFLNVVNDDGFSYNAEVMKPFPCLNC